MRAATRSEIKKAQRLCPGALCFEELMQFESHSPRGFTPVISGVTKQGNRLTVSHYS